jgi:dolichol-phosphate mannosyltransferase
MKKLISVITPAYNEEANVDELARRLANVFDEEDRYDWEAIVVENGSFDSSYERLVELNRRDARFKVIQLARNFRMDGGITAGLESAKGDAVVIMASDLQDPPELIHQFLRKWEHGYDVVYQIVTERQGTGPIRTFNSKLFYWLAGKLTDGRIPPNVSDFRLADRKVYESVRGMRERNRFVRGLFAWSGFRATGIEHPREPRTGGVSGAHTLGVLSLAVKGIFAHSYVPLRLISIFGMVLSVLSVVALFALTASFFIWGVPFAGFGTIVSITVLMFGFLFTMLGVLSEYIGLIYEEVKQRPNFVVRATVGFEHDVAPAHEIDGAPAHELDGAPAVS